MGSNDNRQTKVFTEAEYRQNASQVIDHAAKTGTAIVSRSDGSPRVIIAIPPPDTTDTNR